MNKGGYKKWGQMQKTKKYQPYPKPYPKKESLMKWVLVGPQKKLHGVVTKKKVAAIVSEVAEDLEMQVVPAPEEFDQRMFFSMRARLAHFDETGKPFPAGIADDINTAQDHANYLDTFNENLPTVLVNDPRIPKPQNIGFASTLPKGTIIDNRAVGGGIVVTSSPPTPKTPTTPSFGEGDVIPETPEKSQDEDEDKDEEVHNLIIPPNPNDTLEDLVGNVFGIPGTSCVMIVPSQ